MHQHTPSLHKIYLKLNDHFGPLNWWPAETPFEVVVGAILTQNTAWINVEKAIANLKNANALTPERIAGLPLEKLEELIRPSGFFRQKSKRLQDFAIFLLLECDGALDELCGGTIDEARERLLTRKGIGPETADSILLYATARPSFVVDAYTRRIFTRLGIISGTESYESVRNLFMQSLPEDTQLFNEYHALIVELAKTHCRKRSPSCETCPIVTECTFPHS
jgi:endonuclease-3 related protein